LDFSKEFISSFKNPPPPPKNGKHWDHMISYTPFSGPIIPVSSKEAQYKRYLSQLEAKFSRRSRSSYLDLYRYTHSFITFREKTICETSCNDGEGPIRLLATQLIGFTITVTNSLLSMEKLL
jgi:hypothetical protein